MVMVTVALAGTLGAFGRRGEEGVGGGGVVDGLEEMRLPSAVPVAMASTVLGVQLRFHLRDAVEEVGAVGDVLEGAGREGVADGGVVSRERVFRRHSRRRGTRRRGRGRSRRAIRGCR